MTMLALKRATHQHRNSTSNRTLNTKCFRVLAEGRNISANPNNDEFVIGTLQSQPLVNIPTTNPQFPGSHPEGYNEHMSDTTQAPEQNTRSYDVTVSFINWWVSTLEALGQLNYIPQTPGVPLSS